MPVGPRVPSFPAPAYGSVSSGVTGGLRPIDVDLDDVPAAAAGPSRSRGGVMGGAGNDDAIRLTDDDALVSRISAINLGYIDDPYAALLLNSKTRSSLRGPSAPSPVGLGGASAFGGNGGAGSIPSRLGPGPASSGGGRGGGSENRRPPVINVGTHHRTYAIDAIVERFLLSSNDDENDGLEGKGKGRKGKKQIVSLGAGSDTRFWKIRSNPQQSAHLSKYVEIDFPHVTGPKARKIATTRHLSGALFTQEDAPDRKPTIGLGGTRLDSSLYSLIPLDLRQAAAASASASAPASRVRQQQQTVSSHSTSSEHDHLRDADDDDDDDKIEEQHYHKDKDKGNATNLSSLLLDSSSPTLLDPSLPTLVIAECLFCYMQPDEGDAILRWFAETFKRGGGGCEVIVYEMHGLSDAFGQVMTRNLQSRGITLPGATFASPQEHADRLRRCGFDADSTSAYSLKEIRATQIPQRELERISRLEHLDEIEELDLLLGHYTIAHGST